MGTEQKKYIELETIIENKYATFDSFEDGTYLNDPLVRELSMSAGQSLVTFYMMFYNENVNPYTMQYKGRLTNDEYIFFLLKNKKIIG